MSTVVVEEMTTAFKCVVAVVRIRNAIRSLTTGGQTYLPSRRFDSDAIDRSNKLETIVLFFGAWSETGRFPIVFIL